ncbi:MAG TPA: uracil-DNA glycosylase family protein [Gemmatimonadaceae bacterium]|nr:uracil-DNA glycosylase family protein [Gemmatimonadaceae bacterium]
MSAEDRLRRYLEQRRELGESELVLDGMSVDEVMKIIGALGTGSPASSGNAAANNARSGSGRFADAPPEDELREPGAGRGDVEIPETADWREALRAVGAERPSAGAPRPRPAADGRSTPEPGRSDPDPRGEDPELPGPTPLEGRDASAVSPAREAAREGNTQPERPAIDAPQGIVVGERFDDEPVPEIAACKTLEEVAALVAGCQRCDLYRTALNPVPGEGDAHARLMCIGEAPGAKEDETGRPFVGAAGELLTKILAAINLRRDEVFIANVLKHRPPGNRNPLPQEVAACSPYLVRQVALIRPKVIITFGAFAAQTLLDTKLAIGKLRGSVHRYHGIPVVVTYHPAALLRNPAWKRPTWEDVQLARRILDNSPA